MSKRERAGVQMAAVAVVLAGLFQFGMSPLLDQKKKLAGDVRDAQEKLDGDQALVARSPKMNQNWHDMMVAGLTDDPSTAESRILHGVSDWAQEVGLTLGSLKPERAEQDKQFQRISFHAAGTGTMASVSRFLWRIESARIPVRVTDLQLSSRKDGMDDLQFQVGISTLCLIKEPPKSEATAGKEQMP